MLAGYITVRQKQNKLTMLIIYIGNVSLVLQTSGTQKDRSGPDINGIISTDNMSPV